MTWTMDPPCSPRNPPPARTPITGIACGSLSDVPLPVVGNVSKSFGVVENTSTGRYVSTTIELTPRPGAT